MTIGEQIQTMRIQNGLTQERLAEMLEVSRQSVSKWELGAAVPDVDKFIRMSKLFSVSVDTLLLNDPTGISTPENPLHLGSVYLVVKDFERSIKFYETFLGQSVSNRCPSGNKFVEFYIDNKCLALMNEDNIKGHCAHEGTDTDYKFVMNFWVEDLLTEYERVKSLGIGEVSEILEAYPTYHYFRLRDPDNNCIEITGGYTVNNDNPVCQSCGMKMQTGDFGTNADGGENREYCKYCFENGKFSGAQTLEEKIESNIRFWVDEENGITEDMARQKLREFFPTLKRWKNSL